MPSILDNLEAEWDHDRHAVGDWFHRRRQTSAGTPAAAVTIETATQEEPVSLSTDLHNLAARLENFDEDALAKLEAVKASPKTAAAFDVIASLTHVDPGPVFDGLLAAMQALAPQPAAAPAETPQQPVPSGPQVAGQA